MGLFTTRTILIFLGLSTVVGEELSKANVDEYLLRSSVFYGLIATAAEEPLTSVCRKELSRTAEEVVNRRRWAIKMMDSSGVPDGGLYFGDTYWLGNRRQCEATGIVKNIASVNPATGPVTIETVADIPPFPIAYFAAYFTHNSDIQLITHMENEYRMTWSVCLPKSCEGPELKTLLQKYFDSKMLQYQSLYNTTYQMEEVKKLVDDYSWLSYPITIIMAILVVLLIALCIAGTIFDIKYYRPMLKSFKKRNTTTTTINNNLCENSQLNKNVVNVKDEKNDQVTDQKNVKPLKLSLSLRMLLCFSVSKNNKAIFNIEGDSDTMTCIHGLRFFCMLYAIIGHSILFMQEFFSNKSFVFYVADEMFLQIFYQAAYAIDSFFCISGFLVAYAFFTKEYNPDPNKKYKLQGRAFLYVSGIIRRFLRLTPSYMFTLAFAYILSDWRYRETPFWSNERNDLICPNYWWRNLLFINTLFPRSEMCLSWSWYISADMQFLIIINLFLVLSTMYFKTAVSLLTIFFFACMGFSVNLVYRREFIPYLDTIYLSKEDFYDHPLVRIGPYIVGVFAAYFLYYYKKTFPFKKPVVWIMWTFSMIVYVYIMFSYLDRNFSQTYSMTYMALARIIWAIATAWVIIACETGNGGIINKILSFKYLFPLSRLSFMAYLINPIIIFWLSSYTDKSYKAEIPKIFYMSTGYIVLTYFVAYFLTILVESPNIGITKIFFDFMKGNRKESQVINANNNIVISTSNENIKISENKVDCKS